MATRRRSLRRGDQQPARGEHPHHLAHGLLDDAQYLMHTGDAEGGAAAVEEAHGIAGRLRCQPLLDRARRPDACKPRRRTGT